MKPHKTDFFIEIINAQYVKAAHRAPRRGEHTKPARILGELNPDKSDFITGQGSTFDHIIAGEKPRPTLIDDSGLWAAPTKAPSQSERDAAAFARDNPVSNITVNAGMALRMGLRRLLHIDPATERDDAT